ncbi:MAG: hypothetical protein FGM46_04590 [Ferruginibacter sp.]|nr:hypothetical protein [Ferruginibacter sp.]
MKLFILNKSRPAVFFSLNGQDSFLQIKKITLITKRDWGNSLTSIISSFELSYELSSMVYKEGCIIDERKKSLPITISVSPNQTQPIFEMDLKIKNECFTIGSNPNQNHYETLRVEWKEIRSIPEEFELKFDTELYDMDFKHQANSQFLL